MFQRYTLVARDLGIDAAGRAMKRAFTLIELLVVIAIIAILAAILFPVFAQAKAAAKKTQSLSNVKQTDLGIIMYAGDVDDSFPAGEPNILGGWNTGYVGWQFPINADQTETDGLSWANSTYAYVKNRDILKNPASAGTWNPYGYGATQPGTSYTYNGDLQYSSSTAVVAPVTTVVLWSGFLNNTWSGRNWSLPLLNCGDKNSSCVYVPNNGTATGNGTSDSIYIYGGYPNYSKWVHGQGSNFSFVDGHAKYLPAKGDYRNDPWATGNTDGIIYKPGGGYAVWGANGHACLFGLDNPCGI